MAVIPVPPYYQRYDSTKDYVQSLALPGRVAQSAEWNDLGAMFLDYTSRLGNSIFRNGNIISGCELTLVGTRATVTEGIIFLNGLIRPVSEQSFDLTLLGTEYINAMVEETIITESEDSSLYDPASGSENYGQPGVHMRKQVVKFGADIENAAIIWELRDGILVTATEGGNEFDAITQVLARRTYDESGNYRVSGLVIREKGLENADTIDVTLTEGKAYVLGYEINKPVATTFQVAKAVSTREVDGEAYVYSASNTQREFTLANHPVAAIDQIITTLRITQEITRGSIGGGIDYLPNTPVLEIDSVVQGETTYVRGVDWQKSGDGIDWSLLGSEPSIGSQYTVTYRYNKTMLSEEYQLTVNYTTGVSKVKLLGEAPVADSLVYFSYQFYLARKDLVMLDRYGSVVVVQGTPDVYRSLIVPMVVDDNMLPLGTITIKPNQPDLAIINQSIEASSMEDIQKTITRVSDLEYNQAISDLDKEAEEGEPATELKGILTDNFIGFTKADINHIEWDAAMDFAREELTLPATGSVLPGTPDDGSFDTFYGMVGTTITAPYDEVSIYHQPLATRTMLVNPYAVFDPIIPVIATPNVDNWIEQSHIVIGTDPVVVSSIRSWWMVGGTEWTNEEQQSWDNLDLGTSTSTTRGRDSTTTTTVTNEILSSAIPFIRIRDVEIHSYGFEPISDNIEVTFDDRFVTMVPASEEYRGTKAGTLRANGVGEIRGKFTIPSNVPCGTKSIKVSYPGDELRYPKVGNTTYTANGRLNTLKTTILKQTVWEDSRDPLAQSFQVEEEMYLTSVDLYFATKDPTLPVVVHLRNMVNGYPGNIIYGEAILPSTAINVSGDASAVTKCTFTNAIQIQANTQYCVVIMSDSNLPSMWIAKLGEDEVSTGVPVSANPYTSGVLFSSSNAITWTAHQDMDLKFQIYRANYTGRGSIVYNPIPVTQADRIVLAIDSMSPSDTSLQWFYRVNGSGSWIPIEIYSEREMGVIASTIQLKVEFTAQPTKSPMISVENLQLAYFLNRQQCRYITRNVELPEGYNNIKVYLDVTSLQNTDFSVYYATDTDGITWVEMVDPERTTVDESYVRYLFNVNLPSTMNDFRLRIIMNTTNVVSRPRAKRLMCILKDI